jgi:Undecaprenyl-phosphate galactose phosphotransferase WbaP
MQLKQPLSLNLRRMPIYPWRQVAALMAADVLGLGLAAVVTVLGRWLWGGEFLPSLYWQWWPMLGLFIVAYSIVGLYPGIALSPVDELRWLSLSTTLIYMVVGSAIFLSRSGELYSRLIFLFAWGGSLLMVPLARGIVRTLFARRSWWGCPVLILGAGKTGDMVVRTLLRHPGLGLKPVIVLDDDPRTHGERYGIPVQGGIERAPVIAQAAKIDWAVLAMPGVSPQRLVHILESYGQTFAHLLVIPDLFGLASLWVAPQDLGGVLALNVRQQLLLPLPRLTKAWIDLSLALLIGVLCLPILLLLAILIKLDSRGPIFYSQTRIGKAGKSFQAIKFRTMAVNADQLLEHYLQRQPELRTLWQQDHKLKKDPRLTRVGGWLRRTSLDELPQLWNVLKGEMSLVGPRPIIAEEISRYGDKYPLYTRVKPGLTGLWQVSGRNNISYAERVNLDAYYVRNWSVWLDAYILLRTPWVVLTAEGAY